MGLDNNFIKTRYDYIELIFRFIFRRVVKDNAGLLGSSVAIGVIVRVLTLVGFALTLQAIVAAIEPSIVMSMTEGIFHSFGLTSYFNANSLVYILVGLLLSVYGTAWGLQKTRSILVGRLIKRVLNQAVNFEENVDFEDDVFLVEKTSLLIESVDRSLEILVFIFLVVCMISFMAPGLAMLFFPGLIVLVFVHVVGDKSRLREQERANASRRCYLNVIGDNGKSRRRQFAARSMERDEYISIREVRRQRTATKKQLDAFVGAVAISLIIYYVFSSKLQLGELAGILIVFVAGIRYAIAAGRELGVSIGKILELRAEKHRLRSMLSQS